jgi:hypothetical protein
MGRAVACWTDWNGERLAQVIKFRIRRFLLNFDKFDKVLLNFNRILSNFDQILKYGPDLSSVPAV